jgi:hypothetical protein
MVRRFELNWFGTEEWSTPFDALLLDGIFEESHSDGGASLSNDGGHRISHSISESVEWKGIRSIATFCGFAEGEVVQI